MTDTITQAEAKKLLNRRKGTDWEGMFWRAWQDIADRAEWVPLRQFQFLKPRKFTFDFAFPWLKCAVEIEGCTWVKGRHTSGKGYRDDCRKYNLAVMNGWRVLRYTSDDLKNMPDVLEQVCKLLNSATGGNKC